MSSRPLDGRKCFIIAAIACAVVAPPSSAHAAPGVSAIRHWTAPDHTRIVVDLTSESPYSTRTLTAPDRVVVLIVGGEIAGATTTTQVDDGVVDRVRLNQLGSGTQVVVDLPAAAAYSVFPLKPYREKPSRIVIDVFRERPPSPAPVDATPGEVRPRVVIIDPGHGGEDPGTLGNGKLKEKTIVLDISRRLAELLRARPGYEIHMTRTGDYFVRLAKRKKTAHDEGGDVFISIHANSAPNKRASGSEVFYVSPKGASDQTARELADRENAADLVGGVSPDADGDVLSILVDLKMSDNVDKSKDLASLVSQELRGSGISACTVKQAGFVVLKSLTMPSILVEVGFLTNDGDVRKLKEENHRRRYAEALADAVDAYFDRYSPVSSAPSGMHRVAPGETLWSIARRYGINIQELRELNGLTEDATIRVDQILTVTRA